MLKIGFLWCALCAKKIQPVNVEDVIKSVVYCSKCKTYFKVLIAYNKLYTMEKTHIENPRKRKEAHLKGE